MFLMIKTIEILIILYVLLYKQDKVDIRDIIADYVSIIVLKYGCTLASGLNVSGSRRFQVEVCRQFRVWLRVDDFFL